jgi:hypothetical protein
MKRIMIVTFALLAVFLSAMVAPAFAAAPTVINDVWFVIPIFVKSSIATVPVSIIPDKVWTSDDGTVLHAMNTEISTYIARSPQGQAGTVYVGLMTATSDFVFDTVTQTGTLNMKIKIALGPSSNPAYPNPYGVGTLEGTFTAVVTSLNTLVASNINCPMPGNSQGYFVATHGTGDFENAKLTADVTMNQGTALGGALGIEYMFVGHHFGHTYNEGTLTLHHPGSSQ